MSEKDLDSWTEPKYNKIAREDKKPKANHIGRRKNKDKTKGRKTRRDKILATVQKVKEYKSILDRNKGKKGSMINWHRDHYNRYRSKLHKLIKEHKDVDIDEEWKKL